MSLINKDNADKLLASTRLGLDIWMPQVITAIEDRLRICFADFNELESLSHDERIRRVCPYLAYFVYDKPLQGVLLYVQCFQAPNGHVRFGRFGVKLIPAERLILTDGREAQIPHVSLILLHEGNRNEIIRAPLGFICNQKHDLSSATVVYEHRYFPAMDALGMANTNLIYVGVTRKTWASRWKEHLCSARSGSPYDFHEAIRQFEGRYNSMHSVLAVCHSWEEAMKWEEEFVARQSLRPKGLNMIPGGHAGIAFAAKYGVKAATPRRWEHREAIIKRIQKNASNRGLPNPAQSLRLASDPDLMRKMIEGRNDAFHGNDIAIIRSMHARGVAWREIASELKVKDIYRVRDVVEGKTYKFIS